MLSLFRWNELPHSRLKHSHSPLKRFHTQCWQILTHYWNTPIHRWNTFAHNTEKEKTLGTLSQTLMKHSHMLLQNTHWHSLLACTTAKKERLKVSYGSASPGSRCGGPWRRGSPGREGRDRPGGEACRAAPSWGAKAAPRWTWTALRSCGAPSSGHCASRGGTAGPNSRPLQNEDKGLHEGRHCRNERHRWRRSIWRPWFHRWWRKSAMRLGWFASHQQTIDEVQWCS